MIATSWMAAVVAVVLSAAAPAEPAQPSSRVFRALGAALAAGFRDAEDSEKATALAAEPPPGWVDIPPSQPWAIIEQGRAGELYEVRIAVGSCESREECESYLPAAVVAGLNACAERVRPAAAANVQFPGRGLEERVASEPTRELVYHSEKVGPRTQLHLVLHFDRDLINDITDRWNQAIVTQRLWYAGAGLGMLLGLLAVVYCGLLLDRATHGQRRVRLGLAAVAAASLVVVVAAAVVAAVS